jgi:hypothetical protein
VVYKVLSGILGIFLVISGCFYLYQKHVNDNLQKSLYNKISTLEGLVQETEKGWSERGVEIENLKTQNRDLQNIITARNEEIVSLNDISLRWKNKYFEIKDAKQTVVSSDGKTIVEVPADCQSCVSGIRLRVDFQQIKDYLKVTGHTVTNPSYAEVDIEWIRDIKFTLILTKDKRDHFRVYLDSKESDIIPSSLDLKIDPSVFEKKWYEKISINSHLMVGTTGLVGGLGLNYDFIDNIYVGPAASVVFNGKDMYTFYGINGGWYIFK